MSGHNGKNNAILVAIILLLNSEPLLSLELGKCSGHCSQLTARGIEKFQ